MSISTDVVEAKLATLATNATALASLINSNQTAIEAIQTQTYFGMVESALEDVDKALDSLAVITARLTQLGYS